MPHHWTDTPPTVLTLSPHRSLPRPGFAAVILGVFTLAMMPLFGLLGTVLLWVILPFSLVVLGALWWAFEHTYHTGTTREELALADDMLTLTHTTPKGVVKDWTCNRYWARAEMHERGGPVPNYITLTGNGRRVEIGAFLSEEERKALYHELLDFLRKGQT